jgi:hypothetical protein
VRQPPAYHQPEQQLLPRKIWAEALTRTLNINISPATNQRRNVRFAVRTDWLRVRTPALLNSS